MVRVMIYMAWMTCFETYEARTHQVDSVFACPTQVGHRRALDTSTTRVRHAVLRVSFKKYYLSTWTPVRHNRIWLGHAPDMARTRARHGSDAR